MILDYDDDHESRQCAIWKSPSIGGEKSAARKGRVHARAESGTNIPASDSAAAAN